MKHKYIVAGNRGQAQNWVSTRESEHGVRYIYIHDAQMIQGMMFGPEDVVYVGTYWEHKQFTAITEELNNVHSKAKRANGK